MSNIRITEDFAIKISDFSSGLTLPTSSEAFCIDTRFVMYLLLDMLNRHRGPDILEMASLTRRAAAIDTILEAEGRSTECRAFVEEGLKGRKSTRELLGHGFLSAKDFSKEAYVVK